MESDTDSDCEPQTRQDFTDNLEVVFDYVRSGNYPASFTRVQKKLLRRKAKNFTIQDSTLMYNFKGRHVRVITDKQERLRILKSCHEGLGDTLQSQALGGHHGRDKTSKKVTERFYWPGIIQDVVNLIDHCDPCQRVNRRFEKVPSKLHSIPVTANPWKQIGIDLLGPLPETPDGFKYIVTAIDYYTKWSEAAPLKNKTAKAVAHFLYDLICRHGCPEIQISDQGREFVNQVQQNLHQLTGVEHRVTSAYHPQTNGLVERQNQTTQKGLLKHLEDSQDQWDKVLDGVLFAYRTSVHASTGYSPFFLLYGRQPRLPIDVELDRESTGSNEDSEGQADVDQMVQRMKQLREAADKEEINNIERAQARQKRNYDKRHESGPALAVGEKVLKKNVKNVNRVGGKMESRWIGPYEVTQASKRGVYKLKNLKTNKQYKKKVNVAQLKRYNTPLDSQPTNEKPSPSVKTVPSPQKRKNKQPHVDSQPTNEKPSPTVKTVPSPQTTKNKQPHVDSQSTNEKPSPSMKTVPSPQKRKNNQPHVETSPKRKSTNQQKQQDPNVRITGENKEETILFHPVDRCWQDKVSKKLKLNITRFHRHANSKKINISAEPKKVTKIVGDGNCFFRTISYLITGRQADHKEMRDLVVQYLEENSQVFQRLHSNEEYVEQSCMRDLGEWATEVEIIATATMLATDIYVYSRYGSNYKWLKYGQLRGAPQPVQRSWRKMYISNISEHFVPVLDM